MLSTENGVVHHAGDESGRTAPRQRLPRGQGRLLRQQIIDRAMELVARSDLARAPSARQLTRALGITAPSLYRHFRSMDELVDAMCSTYFEQLGHAMQGATFRIPTAAERLHAMAMAYVRFAAQNPRMYQFATTGRQLRAVESDDQMPSSAPLLHLRNIAQELVDEEWLPPGDALERALQLWATTHGVTSLLASISHLPWGEGESFASRTLHSALLGMRWRGTAC